MKKVAIIILLLLAVQISQAQFKFGLRGGLNFSMIPQETYILNDAETSVSTLRDSYTGFHIGAMSQISLAGVFIMPELLFVSTGHHMVLREGDTEVFYQQKFSQIDVPVMVGSKIGPVRLGVGPVAGIILNSKSELPEDAAFKERFKPTTWGFQAGAGLTLGTMALDLKYQFGLSSLGDGITIGNQTYNFDARTRQIVLSIGFLF
jgi:hypothetical protein